MIKYPLEIELTNYCSLKCISCVSRDLNNRWFLSENHFDLIINFIINNSNNIDFIAIAWLGDTFMHPKIMLYLDKLLMLKDLNIPILIPTKWNTLTEEIIKNIVELKNKGLNINIQLWIFSLKEDVTNFMAGLYDKKIDCFSFNYFEKFKLTVKNLKHYKLDFSIELLLTKFSENEIDSFHKFCKKLEVDWVIHRLHNFWWKLKTYNSLYSSKKFETRCAWVNLKEEESDYYGDICWFYPFINNEWNFFPWSFCTHYNLWNIENFTWNFQDIIDKCYNTIDMNNDFCKVCSDNFNALNLKNNE